MLWDGEQLLAIRDRFGIKPLYWSYGPQGLWLGSEPRTLIQLGHPAAWRPEAIEALFTHQYLLPQQTVFAGIETLEPGCWLRARPGQPPELGRWHSWTGNQVGRKPEAAELRAQINAAVAERSQADQPVACQLSGGLDSAMIATLAARHGIETAYTVQFLGDSEWDEASAAEQLATHSGLRHRVISVDQDELIAHFDAAVVASGGPVINVHAPAKWLLCKAVRDDGYRVLLSGEGADELFWGYEHLVHDHQLVAGLPSFPASTAVEGIHLPVGTSLDTSEVEQAWGWVPSFLRAKATLGNRLRSVSTLNPTGSFEPLLAALGPPPDGHPVCTSAWAWARLCLAGSILERLCDPLEMAWGIEGRMPFLDPEVVALADRIPPESRTCSAMGKSQLREAAAPLLPAEFTRRAKHPFMGPPLRLTDSLLAKLLGGPSLPFIDRSRLEAALESHATSAANRVPWDPVWLTVLSCQALAEAYSL